MKKRIEIIAAACPLLFATACGKKIPRGMSEKTYNAGMQALEIEESYLNGKITADEASMQLDTIYSLLDTFEFDDLNERAKNQIVSIYVTTFTLDLLLENDVSKSYDKLKDALTN